MNPELERLRYRGIRPAQIAADLDITPDQVLKLIRVGRLEAVDIGSRQKPEYRVRGESYERFLRERSVRPSEAAA